MGAGWIRKAGNEESNRLVLRRPVESAPTGKTHPKRALHSQAPAPFVRADSALTVDVSVEELSGHYARHPFDPFLFGPAPALSHLLVGLDP